MSDMSLVKKLEQGGKEAGELFRQALSGKGEIQTNALITIQENPKQAIALLQNYEELGLTPRGSSKVLDLIVEQFKDSDEATQLMQEHLTPESIAQIISASSDLPSSAVIVAPQDSVIQAMMADVGGSIEESPMLSILMIRAWALKLIDRDDYQEILERYLGARKIKEYIVLALAHEFDSITTDLYDEVGITQEDGEEILKTLKTDKDDPMVIDEEVFHEAIIKLQERRREFAKKELFTEEQQSAEKIADELDF